MPIGLIEWRAGIGLYGHIVWKVTTSLVSLLELIWPILKVPCILCRFVLIFPLCLVTSFILVSMVSNLPPCLGMYFKVDLLALSVKIFSIVNMTLYLLLIVTFRFCRMCCCCLFRFTKLVRVIDMKVIVTCCSLTIDVYSNSNTEFELFYRLLLSKSGDVHPNPGPMMQSPLKFCHWNLNSILSRESVKIPLIQAYNSVVNFDLIALSETYLNNSISNEAISLEGFSNDVFRSDHPSNGKRGGVCLYYKENMTIKQRIDLQTISECVVAEITSGRKKMFLVVLYRSPSHTSQEFGDFLDGFETMVTKIKDTKPHCLIITGDFNCKSIKWWADGDENAEGIELNELTDSLDLSQLIDKPTHFLENSESCIDLIFTDQPNLFLNSGTHPSLFESCHHDIIHGSVNLNIPSPPPFKRRVWKYEKANVESLKSDLLQINWENEFRGCSCTEATDIFTKKLLSLCSSHIPNSEILCNPKDPPWITDVVKKAIRRKHRVHRNFLKNGRNTSDRDRAKAVRNETTRTIEQAKERYFCDLGQKLCDPSRGVKAYWETIHKILNRKKVARLHNWLSGHAQFVSQKKISQSSAIEQLILKAGLTSTFLLPVRTEPIKLLNSHKLLYMLRPSVGSELLRLIDHTGCATTFAQVETRLYNYAKYLVGTEVLVRGNTRTVYHLG